MWHTHLKKRLSKQNHVVQKTKRHHHEPKLEPDHDQVLPTTNSSSNTKANYENTMEYGPVSPSISTDMSSLTSTDDDLNNNSNKNDSNDGSIKADSPGNFSEMDDFWSEVFSSDNNSEVVDDFSAISSNSQVQFSETMDYQPEYHALSSNITYDEDMDFWYNVFTRAADSQELII